MAARARVCCPRTVCVRPQVPPAEDLGLEEAAEPHATVTILTWNVW